jgi:hypothetical protein
MAAILAWPRHEKPPPSSPKPLIGFREAGLRKVIDDHLDVNVREVLAVGKKRRQGGKPCIWT